MSGLLKLSFDLEASFKIKLKRLFLSYLICSVFVAGSTFLIYLVGVIFNIDISALTRELEDKDSYYHLFLLVVLGPILEELLFRAFLDFKKYSIFISLFIALIFFTTNLSYYKVPTKETMLQLLLSLALASCVFLFKQKVLDGLKKHFILLFYVSAILFSAVHLKNFLPMNQKLWYVYPLFILPQFFMGLGLAYIRVKNGLLWAIVLHVMINFLPGLLMLVSLLNL